jgi:hypothetical protein
MEVFMNYQKGLYGISRRRFISQVLPACSLVCLGAGSGLFGFSPLVKKALQEAKHKFDEEFPQKLTSRQFAEMMFGREFIPFLKLASGEIGKEKLTSILKKYAAVKGKETGEMIAKQSGGNDFSIWKKAFTPENPNFNAMLTMSITEDKENVHELKVTECLLASVFLKADAGDFGFASVCFGDYEMASSFNARIKMERDKTLMQGHAYCNHRYLFI